MSDNDYDDMPGLQDVLEEETESIPGLSDLSGEEDDDTPELSEVSKHRYAKFTMPALSKVSLPSRDPRLPTFYEFKEHAQVPAAVVGRGRIFVYVHDTSEAGNLKYYDFAKDLTFPDGTEEAVTAAGFLKLRPSDFVFARSAHGSGAEEDDHPVVWVTGSESLPDGLETSIEKLQTDILGPDELIDEDKARKVDGVWKGGIHWERSDHAINIAASERCYTVAQSYQIQRNLTSPAVGAKVYGDPTDHHTLRRKIIETAAPVALASLQRAPGAYVDVLRTQADVNNLPPIGHEQNFAFPTMQLNIASTKSHDALAGM
ncbi:hypothetical protein K466DRAFT_606793 [Polyporus arcularius HHB13444]|uniref:Uncharacterized protein n=2 Tax=Polyporaceae TaxID=5317 RepID=A0A5C3NLP3_9APHY|nr:hypothetical protein K466DRAFT_606793 [Polyporus arcularius HHB13444]